MPLVTRWMLCFSLIFSGLLHAQWFDDTQAAPEVDDKVLSISQDISKLPDPLFMTSRDELKVNRLLKVVINEQQRQTRRYTKALESFRDSGEDEQWLEVESANLTLVTLSKNKQALLELTDRATYDQLTGFGPTGVLQFKLEWEQTKLNIEYLIFYQVRAFQGLINDVRISPIPVLGAGFKVLLIYVVLVWWLSNSARLIELFKRTQLDSVTEPPFWVRCVWYVSRAHRAIAWLIAITLSLRVLSSVPSLQHLALLEIFTWWVLGGSIAISFLLEFVRRNSQSTSPEITRLRLKTLRMYVWSIIVTGVILQLSVHTLGKGTIYAWITSLVVFWFAFITVLVLRSWRKTTFEVLESVPERPVLVHWAVRKQNTFVLNIVATAFGIVWIAISSLKHRIVNVLSQYSLFSQMLVYLFRIEVAKQSQTNQANKEYARLKGDKVFDYITPGNVDSTLINYAADEVKQLSKYLLTDSPAVCVISGERGVGTTTFLNTMLNKVKNAEPIYVDCPHSGYADLLKHLAVCLGLEEESSEIQIMAFLRKSETTYLIAFDNTQRLVKPMVGGLNDLIRLANLMRRSKKNHRVIMAIEKASWRFVDRARGERLLFDWVSFLPKWTESQLGELFDTRICQNEEHTFSFDGLVVPKQWDQEDISEEERARKGFYRILWHYSDGNPTVALRFFRLSLYKHKETEDVVVRLFNAPESQELEKMPKPMLAVLRSIVQLEIASSEELSECTQLSVAEVLGTLRYFQSRGYIEWKDDKARISDHWFRHITNVLDRQHLLVK